MKWQLTEAHYIDERVLPAGTMVGDDTPFPFRSTYNDPKIGRKIGDHLPPTGDMRPMDAEAREAFDRAFGGEEPPGDPANSTPLTGAENAPRVQGAAVPPQQGQGAQTAPNPAPGESGKPTGLKMQNPSPNTPQPPLKPELQKPAGHDSSKNPGDSKDTETAKAPDIKKL